MFQKLHLEVSNILNYDNHINDISDETASKCYYCAFEVANLFNYKNKNGGVNCLFLPPEDNNSYFPMSLPVKELRIIIKNEYYIGGQETQIYYLDFENKKQIEEYLTDIIKNIENSANNQNEEVNPRDYFFTQEEILNYQRMKNCLNYFYKRKMLLFFIL